MKKMRDLMEAVMVLNENEGYPSAIQQACKMIEDGEMALLDAINDFYCEKAKALSTQWPGFYVSLSGGNGSEDISLIPPIEVVERALADDDYYDELLSRTTAVLKHDDFFAMLDELGSQHRNLSVTCGHVVFKEGQEISEAEMKNHQKTLPGHQKRIGEYGFETY